ncbi:MAG: hypothetical protein LBD14_03945 [Puniceicoccales bacterium]|jgi:hypothetical protein|nr:hypothetical protein [Puniceicoccales bacterium]
MNTPALTPNDPRLTDLLLGEIHDPALAQKLRDELAHNPALRHEYAALGTLAQTLEKNFRDELAAIPDTTPAATPKVIPQIIPFPKRRPMLATASHAHTNPPRNSIPILCLLGATAALALYLALQNPGAPTPAPTTAATARGDTPIQLRPPPATRPSYAETIYKITPAPTDPALATLVAQLPVRTPGGGENARVATATNHTASLCLRAAGPAYVQHLRNNLLQRHRPAREHLRIDSLVNALVTTTPAHLPAQTPRPLHATAEAIPAPWAENHWLVRITLHARATIADARATAGFSTTHVASWRLLGCEDGALNARPLDTPVTLHTGETLTTLFELVPAANATTPGKIHLALSDATGTTTLLSAPLPIQTLETASDDTRLAAATAAFALALRESQYRGTATLALSGRLAQSINNPNKNLLDDLIRAATPLMQ